MHWTCVAPFDLLLLNTLFAESFVQAAKKMSSWWGWIAIALWGGKTRGTGNNSSVCGCQFCGCEWDSGIPLNESRLLKQSYWIACTQNILRGTLKQDGDFWIIWILGFKNEQKMYKSVCDIHFTIKLEIRVSQNLSRVGGEGSWNPGMEAGEKLSKLCNYRL